ncbi:hypothetical protein HK097_007739 [Rhizophlyctis rosea]|uniref:Uncharacterized protein n=1 Tax=Rhizophlyctis rosea TaxID=64517 RepID=A0AAD5SCR1_9FUNG|nr:hypothetical protein HK097_007739 [Rhizophlyctis rosea]
MPRSDTKSALSYFDITCPRCLCHGPTAIIFQATGYACQNELCDNYLNDKPIQDMVLWCRVPDCEDEKNGALFLHKHNCQGYYAAHIRSAHPEIVAQCPKMRKRKRVEVYDKDSDPDGEEMSGGSGTGDGESDDGSELEWSGLNSGGSSLTNTKKRRKAKDDGVGANLRGAENGGRLSIKIPQPENHSADAASFSSVPSMLPSSSEPPIIPPSIDPPSVEPSETNIFLETLQLDLLAQKSEINTLKTHLTQKTLEIQSLTTQSIETRTLLQTATKKSLTLERALTAHKTLTHSQSEEIKTLKTENQLLVARLSCKVKQIADLEQSLDVHKTETAFAETMNQDKLSRAESLRNEVTALRTEVEEERARNVRREARIEQLIADVSDERKDNRDRKNHVASLKRELTRVEGQKRELGRRAQDALRAGVGEVEGKVKKLQASAFLGLFGWDL